MQITNVTVYPLSVTVSERLGDARGGGRTRSTAVLKLVTDDGTVGWGEAFIPGEIASATVATLFEDRVIGMDPFAVESITERWFTDPYHYGRSVFVQAICSAIDVACWDIIGKTVGSPIHRLLGSGERTTLTPYASTMYFADSDRPIETPIEAAHAEGFTAVKVKIGAGPADDRRRVRTAREILGEDALIMADMNGNYRPDQARLSAQRLAEFDLTWIEEPVPPENLSGYRALRSSIATPIAAGEALVGRFAFKRLIDDRLVDVVQPNLARCGGLTEARRIATLATTENVGVTPHVWNSGVGMAAAVQFAAAVPAYPHTQFEPEPALFEFDRSPNPLRSEILSTPFDPSGGTLSVPQDPGLGIDVDEDALELFSTAG